LSGLLGGGEPAVDDASLVERLGRSDDVKKATQWYSVFATDQGLSAWGIPSAM
jgi:hypothetical protein